MSVQPNLLEVEVLGDVECLFHLLDHGLSFGLHEGGYIGTPPAIVDRIGARIELGITSFVFFCFDRASEGTLRLFAEEVMPHFA